MYCRGGESGCVSSLDVEGIRWNSGKGTFRVIIITKLRSISSQNIFQILTSFEFLNEFLIFRVIIFTKFQNLHRIIFQSDIGAETGNSLYIYYTKLPMLAQLPSFLKRSKRRGRKKEARHKPNNRAPTPFQLCRIQADDPPRPRVIASILPIISRELMQRYRPFPPLSSPVIMVMSALYVSARAFVETVEKGRQQLRLAERPGQADYPGNR